MPSPDWHFVRTDCAAIPDEGGDPGDFLFIRPADNWAYGFTQLIEDNEKAELRELEGRADSDDDDKDDDNQFNNRTSDDSNSEEESDSSESTMWLSHIVIRNSCIYI